MIGMIATGHGSFATGITSGLKLLAGEPQDYETVDFLPEDSAEALAQKLDAAYERLSGCEGIVIFADLTGGTPFNVSIRMKMEHPERQIEVIGGSNLPAVLAQRFSHWRCRYWRRVKMPCSDLYRHQTMGKMTTKNKFS